MAFPGRMFSVMILSMAVLLQIAECEPTQDKQALQDFMSKVPHSPRVHWNASISACDWYGVLCDASRSYVSALRLPGVGLLGQIPRGTIGRLSNLRVLSLHSNGLSGPIPADFSNLTLLRSLYIQRNQLSGDFPSSLIRLTRLSRLDLSSNNFSGQLPTVGGGTLTAFNVSNNHLNGPIPRSLAKFPDSSFRGNLQLCGSPLPACNSSIVPSSPAVRSHKKLSTTAIAAIIVAAVVVFLTLLICLVFCLLRRRREPSSKYPKHTPAISRAVGAAASGGEGTSSSKDDLTSGAVEGERSKLVFVNNVTGAGAVYSFDLEDLLRASAEVLGKGSVGTTYKAVLEEGTTVVVKRLKDVAAAKREFDMRMEVLGSCRHENLVPLRAFYFSKDEKLLVYDYFPAGSLSSLLHGKTPLNWESRMKLALGTARGLSYLHVSGKVVHGNIKSSNILVNQDHQEGVVGDFGLNPLFGCSGPPHRMAGYRAPEVLESRKVTFNSDVYSFGVLLLELLTGKSPNQASLGEEGIDLPRWVQSVVREEWTAEVFDAELMRFSNIEEEMVQLLQIAMSCVQTVPDQRPAMPEVLRMMEGMTRSESDRGLRQSSDDPSKGSGDQTEITPTSSLTP